MSVSDQITRLENAKTALKTSIEAKGVTVPDNATLTDYSFYVDEIQSGGSAGGGSDDVLESLIDRSITAVSNSNITSIGTCAFYDCSNLTTARFTNCTSISASAFYSCSKLTTASFPACTLISNYAFASCTSLTTASFPNCSKIGYNAFRGCSKLTAASFPACTIISGYAFVSCSKLTTASFPACTLISNYAFSACTSLTTANFPNCTSISASAFYRCSNLTTVNFPVCTSIGNGAFASCSNLTTVSFPVCTSISNYAFTRCTSLTTASFPNCLFVGRGAFDRCEKLMSLYLIGSSVPILSNVDAFYATPMSVSTLTGAFGSIFVQASLLDAFKSATNWATYADRIVAYGEQGGGEQGGGEQGGETTTITFTIGQTSYQAEQGMTFQDWVNSTYNTDNFFIQGNSIYSAGGSSFIDSTPSSIINAGYTYYLIYAGAGGA